MSTEPASTSRSGERNTKTKKRTVEVPETEERSGEKQKRKTKSKIGKKSTGDVEEEIESPKHKEKKHKRKNRDVDAENGAPDAVDGADLPLRKKQKKRKDKGAIEAEDEGIAELQATEKIKKESMHKDKGSRDADGAVASGSDWTSKEKKKHEKKRDKKARKKETASSSLLNPADDAELTDKARGALSYAHTRLSASDGWKFNKAHQNWIVKHVFSCNDIPEKYFPVVTAYLSGCQGGVRDNLVQNCSKQLDASPEVCSAPDSTPTPVPAPSALTEDTEAEPLKLASKIPSPATQEAIKARTRTLLEVLGSSSSQD